MGRRLGDYIFRYCCQNIARGRLPAHIGKNKANKIMVPGEGFEPPTFGLQNRCTATVLTRHMEIFSMI
jgi:hypothetical protein